MPFASFNAEQCYLNSKGVIKEYYYNNLPPNIDNIRIWGDPICNISDL